MDNSLTISKRVFSAFVAALTIVWAAGVAAFAVPQTASAANPGDRIRGTSFSTVYYYGYDGARYAFPNEKTHNTWFNDFNGVQTISDSALENITLGGNVVYRPGSRWIKITSAAETYAVARDGMIHWIESESVASDLAGSAWNTMIDDVADVFFANYMEGMSLSSPMTWNGALYMDGGDYYVAWDGEKRMLSSAARSANNLENRFFLTGSNIDDSALTAGADITGFVCELSDASQSGECGSETTTPVGGNLSVSVASNTTPATTVPNSASGVVATSWTLSAAQATNLSSMTLSLGGLATVGDFSDVYLYEGNARLTDGRTFNSSTRTATFAGLNLNFNAGQTRTLSAVVDMNDAADSSSRNFRIGLAGASALTTNGTVSGSFPAWGNTHSIADLAVGSVEIRRTGSLSNPSVGATDHTIARFTVQAGNEEDIDLNALTLEIRRANDHSNYKLWQGTTQVATGQTLNRDLVLFSFNSPMLLEEGMSRNFHVTADIGGKVDETIRTYMVSDADLRATGRTFGFGVNITNAANNDYRTVGNASTVTIEGGKVTLSFVGPNDADVRSGASAHKFLEFNLTAEEWAEVQSMTFDLDYDLVNVNAVRQPLRNIRLINAATGAVLDNTEWDGLNTNGGVQDTEELEFTNRFHVNAGETLRLAVVADVNRNDSEDGDVFSVSLGNVRDGAEAENCGSICLENIDRDDISDIVPSTGVSGRDQTVVAAGLTLSLANTPNGAISVVRGTSNVEVAAFNFEAADGDDVQVTDLTLNVESETDDEPGDFVSACSLHDRSNDNALVAGPRSVDNNDNLVFSSFNWTIAGGQNKILSVHCNFADVTADEEEFNWVLDSEEDVTALEVETGDTLEVAGGLLNDGPAVWVAVSNAGTLARAVDASRPDAKFLLSGSSDQSVSTFRFTASNEDFRVRTLTFVDSAANGTSPISSVTITYPTETGTANRTVALTGNEARFTNLDMYVARNTPARVYASVNVAEHRRNNGFADSNDRVQLELAAGTVGNSKYEAIGVGSSTTLRAADATNSSRRHVVRETFPQIKETSGSPPKPLFPPSGPLFNGNLPVFTFNVSANAGEDVVWDGGLFELSGSGAWNTCSATVDVHRLNENSVFLDRLSGGTSTSIDFAMQLHESNLNPIDPVYEVGANQGCSDNEAAPDTAAAPAGTLPAKYIAITLDEGEVIPAGSSRTFELTFNVSGAAEGDSLQVSIPRESALPTVAGVTELNENELGATDTTVTLDDASAFEVGRIAVVGNERMLVVGVAGNDLTVIRGYAGTTAAHNHADNAAVGLALTSFLWQDDGTLAAANALEEYWGGYLVSNLPVRGINLLW